jgi:hypothetical protein
LALGDQQRILDEPAAEVVRQIFRWCLAGLGPTHIAKKLREEQIPTPTEHMLRMELKVKQKPLTIPCDWGSATIRVMLSRREYLARTLVWRVNVNPLNQFMEKRVQKITVHLNFIGAIGKLDILTPETAGSAEIESLCPQTGIAAQNLAFGLC